MTEDNAQSPALDAAIEAIWLKHRPLMFARLAAIEAAVEAVCADGAGHDRDSSPLDEETRATAQRDAHKLAGALGTFGLHEGTRHARLLEHAFAEDGERDVRVLREAMTGLRAELESRPGNSSP